MTFSPGQGAKFQTGGTHHLRIGLLRGDDHTGGQVVAQPTG